MANQYRSVLASSGPAPTGGDALPAEVLSGKTFTNDNGAQTGTMTNNGAVSQTLSGGQTYTIPAGYHNGSGIVTAEEDAVHGSFLSANQETSITVGFKPKYLYVINPTTRVINVYDESESTTQFMYAGASAYVTFKSLGGSGTYELKSIDDTGFTINSMPATGNTCYYVAVK